ncbi:hydantoinase B/oxoprolinase family protein [Methanolobus sp.]|uniref:hydantoinase B/oxoprolinase family protein n=1 Tax=Methanolobus sp. TaxID=1874737 RepID=UPI0025CC5C9F|nr:hydantoinase B/oxoprolinase family protein [Methanolobus sp.]
MSSKDEKWQFWIDRGGTFTDVVARKPDGQLIAHKLLSLDTKHYADAAMHGIRTILGIEPEATLPTEEIESIKMGTTVGTNALLERKGEATALVITEGYKDALRIAYQNRPDIFALNIELPDLLYDEVIEIKERYSAAGEELVTLDTESARNELEKIYSSGIRSIAIVLMHAYRYPEHELQLREIAEGIGFTQISLSHEVSPLMKLISSGETTVVDAYLSPVLRRYIDMIASTLEAGGDNTKLIFMQSNGGMVDAMQFRGRDCILSGPAGGIVGAVETSRTAGFEKVVTFDMGGTSTDVAHYSGEYERSFETEIAGVHLRSPMLYIHTVAAGGGSILHFDAGRFRVGPDSAGSEPGPACYRKDGPLTITDCNLMLGKIDPQHFPHVFGHGADMPLDADIVKEKFSALAEEVSVFTGEQHSAEQVAEGFLKIAIENMANAIKKISIQRGYDTKDYVLCCFGGAGAQHACGVADALGIKKILIHPFAGVLSAYGMGLADQRIMKEHAVEKKLGRELIAEIRDIAAELEKSGRKEMRMQGVSEEEITALHKVHVKYMDAGTSIIADLENEEEIRESFENEHKNRFGFIIDNKELVIEAVSTEIIGAGEEMHRFIMAQDPRNRTRKLPDTTIYTCGDFHKTPVYRREAIAGTKVNGPAIIVEANTTVVIEPGWQAEVTENQELVLERTIPLPKRESIGTEADPVMLEIFNNRFMSIAQHMGYTLQNTAYSVNIKERLDFSCALFDCEGNLIANAPHIPVHLGSMGESVRAIIRKFPDMEPGDVFMLNSPFEGGTHLPDITVITPVFHAGNVAFYVASRGHHADVGGITPGSIPPESRHIEEEGVITSGQRIVSSGEFLEDEVNEWLTSGKYPARNPFQNVADLKAQVAANEKGVRELEKLVEHFSMKTVQAYMKHVMDNAEESVRRVIEVLKGGEYSLSFDDGAVVCVKVRIDREKRSAHIDFTGTSRQHQGNLNAPVAVCKAAVLYVFRSLVEKDIPLNEGCLQPLDISIPEGSMLNPEYPAAVVAGNVETSQYIVDALFGALGVMAGSQGTMNNFTFGDEEFQYYETICGGSGAGNAFDGTDAVQTHMTNSRITDPEVLEWRFPVRLEEFSIRKDSGGEGAHNGGCGVVRKIRFLRPMKAAIISSHRKFPPKGLNGGEDGKSGHNYVVRAGGDVEKLDGRALVEMEAGELFVVKTPGAGGFGKKKSIK